jgi:GT2 family glycosyltransferase
MGGYDESFFAYLEDVDLGLRLRASGSKGYYAWKARVYHHGGATSGGEYSPLAVRLRTRNSLLLLAKDMVGPLFWRCFPMILTLQLSWMARALGRGRLLSYLKGVAGAFPLIPDMMKERRKIRLQGKERAENLWQAILKSEDLAREDYSSPRQGDKSALLHWYFRVF